ncbi:MAG: arsenite methyltransferase [Candidatus Kapabacteria bacterium]|nr:arsenite methyltransferase [Ignavibacteriota bacterium]MCW5885840.1 arsenite methyltransferase [Candidatus Kapabacteria bacterium]
MNTYNNDNIKNKVREDYSKVALLNTLDSSSGCCGSPILVNSELSLNMGYKNSDLKAVPDGSNMGLGCGNPQAIASIKSGEYVLDLGSGGGFDSFLASPQAGESGKVIGVDMTPEMVSKARSNAEKSGFSNVEFRLGEIEYLPVADNSIDVIISNCVINLSPDKQQVFNEAFRVLKSGGRLAISDVVAFAKFPDEVRSNLTLYSSCISGAEEIDKLEQIIRNSGFENIEIKPKDESKKFMKEWAPGTNLTDFVVSATIEAVKP